MAEVKKSVKISFVILLIMMILALVYAFITLFMPQVIVARSFQGFTGQSFAEYAASSPTVAGYILVLERMAGGVGLALVLGGLIVLMTAFKKAEKWAWFFVLVTALIGWVNNLIANIAFKNSMTITIIVVGLILLAIGLLIPVKDFFGKK
ncbi:hypothetical protein KAS45_04065 [candidate division WOR-3 bacterium]|nr:hypothetical protein [candidate division WOR-3 bacterium]